MLKKCPTYFGTLEQLQEGRWRSSGGERRSEGWTPDFQRVKIFFLFRYYRKITEIFLPYFRILQQLQDQIRRGGAAQNGVLREGWRVGETPDLRG